MAQEKLISMVELLIKFRDDNYSAVQLRRDLKHYKLPEFLRGLKAYPTKPVLVEPTKPVLAESTKQHFHDHCFDDFVRQERLDGIYNLDKGSRPFAANFLGRCHGCGLVINSGNRVVLRRVERAEVQTG